MASLTEYKQKRKFDKTPEPGPTRKKTKTGRMFVVQKHRATQLHYDFRLEVDGVLKSWAVPKGPSLDPTVKRLAMQVEDHPVDYAKFEGVIPEGEYGGGTVMVWDYGTYEPENTDDVASALRKGELKFSLDGQKLKGSWVLVRTRDRQRTLAEIAEDEGGNVKKAATGDPKNIPRRTGIKRRKKGARAKVWHSK